MNLVVDLDFELAALLEMMVHRHEAGASHAMLVAFDEEGYALGWTGLVGNHTSTYLHPRAWGIGLNTACKGVLWHMGQQLGYEQLVASVDTDNLRSVAACRKTLAGSSEHQYFDAAHNRVSLDFTFTDLPVGAAAMTRPQQQALHQLAS